MQCISRRCQAKFLNSAKYLTNHDGSCIAHVQNYDNHLFSKSGISRNRIGNTEKRRNSQVYKQRFVKFVLKYRGVKEKKTQQATGYDQWTLYIYISGTITFSHLIVKTMKPRYQSFTRIGR
jgi:hypothetical protein